MNNSSDNVLPPKISIRANFRRKNLTGSSFKGCRLKGFNFSQASLEEVDFSYSISGIPSQSIFLHILLLIVIILSSGCMAAFAAFLAVVLFLPSIISLITIIPGILVFAIGASIFVLVLTRGLREQAFGTIAGAGAGAVASAIAIGGNSGVIAGTVGTISGVFAIAFVAHLLNLLGSFTIVLVAATIAVANVFLNTYVAWQALKGNPKFDRVRKFAISLASFWGTSFKEANLAKANFTGAHLKNTSFENATVTHACWYQATGLEYAKLDGTILDQPEVRQLLITNNGRNKSFVGLDLRGANLIDADLEGADLKEANLNQAQLQGANLKGANLTNASVVGADLTGAYLTGACIESWNVDSSTILDDVQCLYVYQLEFPNSFGHRERLPHNPDKVFQPGDFEQMFKEVMNEVKLLIRGGVNPSALRAALDKIKQEHGILSENIQGIEKHQQDVILTLRVPESADKAKIEADWDEAYNNRLEAVKNQALLQGAQQRADDLKEVTNNIVTSLGNLLTNLTINTTAMTHSNNPNINVNAGGDIGAIGGGDLSIQGVFNLGEISGSVTAAINQLPDESSIPDQPSLKELLTQLQSVIEEAQELSTEDKTDLLEQIKVLSSIKEADESEKVTLARKARKIFEATLRVLPDTAKIVDACGKLLPLVMKSIGVIL